MNGVFYQIGEMLGGLLLVMLVAGAIVGIAHLGWWIFVVAVKAAVAM